MPMYTHLCAMADGPGERAEGCQKNMRKKLQEARRGMFSLNTEHENIHDMASHPEISSKKVARKRRKATSPKKEGENKYNLDLLNIGVSGRPMNF